MRVDAPGSVTCWLHLFNHNSLHLLSAHYMPRTVFEASQGTSPVTNITTLWSRSSYYSYFLGVETNPANGRAGVLTSAAWEHSLLTEATHTLLPALCMPVIFQRREWSHPCLSIRHDLSGFPFFFNSMPAVPAFSSCICHIAPPRVLNFVTIFMMVSQHRLHEQGIRVHSVVTGQGT